MTDTNPDLRTAAKGVLDEMTEVIEQRIGPSSGTDPTPLEKGEAESLIIDWFRTLQAAMAKDLRAAAEERDAGRALAADATEPALSEGACAWGKDGMAGLLPDGPHFRCLRPGEIPMVWRAENGYDVKRSFCMVHASDVARFGWDRPAGSAPKRWTFDVNYEGGPQRVDYGTGVEWDGGWQWAIYDGPHELDDVVLSGVADEDPTPVLAGLVAEHNRAVDGTPSPLKPRGFGPNFRWAAAPQALEHHVAAYRARVTRLARELAWLEDLLTERNGQVARGEWPPTQPPEGSR